jgi:alpha-L-arabinofuranosidase
MKTTVTLALICSFLLNCQSIITAQPGQSLTVLANKPTAEVQSTMWGVFFEDINFAADGGIYAELVKNRSFEFQKPLMGWKELKQGQATGSVLIINRGEANANNPRFARITADAENGAFGLTNEGFRGMGIGKDKFYEFSMLARKSAEENPTIKIELISSTGEKLGEASLQNFTSEWKKYTVQIQAKGTDAKTKLNVLLQGKGSLDLDMVSLFPRDTWKNRPGGLRADLVQYLADLKPGFVRFPGGCIVEGMDLNNRYQWKKTIGKPEDRKLIMNRWNVEFSGPRSAVDYYQSYGLGFFEYFQLCEDIGAEPLPILNCGMACQYNTGEVVPTDQIDPYVQDALDLIEFANGSVDSKWGKVRAEMGHPSPFNLKLMGVGNEQWDKQYIERYKIFIKAINDKYPNLRIVSSAGPSPEGAKFDYLWSQLKALNANLIDEHYYKSPDWFLKNATRYDNYDRKGPKVFAGEYASHSKGDKAPESRNNWESALTEAAFMTGLERNADVISMASYAPLFAHVDAWQWNPDLIWFDNLQSFGTPNYYVQKLFANNKGTNVVPILHNGETLTGKDSLYASATIDKKTNEVIIKIVNASALPASFDVNLEGVTPSSKTATTQTIQNMDLKAYNTLDNPKNICTQEGIINFAGTKIPIKINGRSVNLMKVACKKL